MGHDAVEGNYEQVILNILARLKQLENAEVSAAELSEISDDTGFGVYPHQYHGALTSFRFFDSAGGQYEPGTFTVVSADTLSGHHACSGAGQANDGDYASAQIPLVAGTYTAKLSYSMGEDFGSFDMVIDGTTVYSENDAYAGSPSENNELTISSILISVSEVHDIRFVVDGKNGSSSGYRFGGSDFTMVRVEIGVV